MSFPFFPSLFTFLGIPPLSEKSSKSPKCASRAAVDLRDRTNKAALPRHSTRKNGSHPLFLDGRAHRHSLQHTGPGLAESLLNVHNKQGPLVTAEVATRYMGLSESNTKARARGCRFNVPACMGEGETAGTKLSADQTVHFASLRPVRWNALHPEQRFWGANFSTAPCALCRPLTIPSTFHSRSISVRRCRCCGSGGRQAASCPALR